jgi:hypothetical protein
MGCLLSIFKFEPLKTDEKSSKYVYFFKLVMILSITNFIVIWVYLKGNYYEISATFESQTVISMDISGPTSVKINLI